MVSHRLATTALAMFALMLAPALAGCLDGASGDDDATSHDYPYDWMALSIEERVDLGLDFYDLVEGNQRSYLPTPGPYDILPMTEHYVEVDLPLEERDAGFPEPPVMHLALWLPDVPEGQTVPVIASIHPYYDFGNPGAHGPPNTEPDLGIGRWVHDQFVPHGYALAQVSTFGSGKSTHCQDVKGRSEQIGIDAVVTWLGTQEWSNGNVAVSGKSYAGTTNWEAAQFSNPHLKTILPISGSIGVQQMFYRNGSSETRAMVYDALYEYSTVDGDGDDLRVCSDDLVGPASPWTTWAGAEYGGAEWSDYWEERYHLPDVLDNYGGSVYIIWGLQDWNVDPYHTVPTHQLLLDRGINVRGLYGQWDHDYADQPTKHNGSLESGYGLEARENMSRADWAIEMFVWLEHYLKGIGPEPGPLVQIQDNLGRWHVADTWPPAEVRRERVPLSAWDHISGTVVDQPNNNIVLEHAGFGDELHLSGVPELELRVTPAGNGGQICALLEDSTEDLRLGHAIMDLRYRDGGYEAQPVVAGQTYTMKMEFNPLDVALPAGHGLRLTLMETCEDYLSGPYNQFPVSLDIGDSSMTLHVLDDPQWIEVSHGTWT